ncbi:GerAB/ArcD/ProY family transporter [Bacillus sp. FDAARGOS_1420]|uniref:GerAB/ArcD/ProY family transporter n=1 Tax=unclassified Bacillus (in: firmicutes) TaxID=185979 RepID=UPI001C5BAF8F|nr:GerAB/ArcD/ProY family transporter [Bacillus sp. FDAARGOS_1420]MBW3496508.1 spore germination protein [Bacillus sp. FDAARGOS_1420]
MKENQSQLTLSQMFFVILQAVTGIGVLTLPYDIYTVSKEDSWITILFSGLIIGIGVLIMWLLLRRFPTLTIFEMVNEIVGLYLGSFLKIIYILFFLYTPICIVLAFSYLLNIWILPETPIWVNTFLILGISVYCAKKKLKVIARFFTTVSLLFLVLFFLISYVLRDVEFLYLLPIGKNGLQNIIKGLPKSSVAFSGFEAILIIFPYSMGNSLQKLKVSIMALGVVTIFYAYSAVVCITFFGPSIMRFMPQPILYALKFQSFQIIERTDLLFFSIWTVSIATSLIINLYIAANGLANLFKRTTQSKFVPYAAVFIFLITLIVPQNKESINSIRQYYALASPIFFLILPGILLILSFLQGKQEPKREIRS